MSPDLKTRVRHYAEHLDELAAPITFEELIDRKVEPVTMPEIERRVLATRRHAWVAAAAAGLVLLLIGGAALLLGNLGTEPDLIDEPTTTTTTVGPTTTTESVSPPAAPSGFSLNSLATGTDLFRPAIGVDGTGNPVVVYGHRPGGDETGAVVDIVHCADPACADVTSSNTIEFSGTEVDVQTAFAPDGSPVMIFTATEQVPELYRCTDPACSGYVTMKLDPDLWIGTVTIDPSGNPAIYGYAENEPRLITCLDSACGESTAATLDLPETWGWAGLVYGRDGNPVLYSLGRDTDRRVSPIYVIRCGDATCSSNNTMTRVLDAKEDEGQLALAIGSDGNLVIAFGSRQLQVVVCHDPACTSTGPIANVGSPMIIESERLALQVSADGHPMIFFTAARATGEPQRPMLAVCADPACASGTLGLVDTLPTAWLAETGTAAGGERLTYGNWEELWVASCDGAGCRNGLLEPDTWDQSPVSETQAPPLGPIMEGWTRVTHNPAVFGPGGGGGFSSVVETDRGVLALGNACDLVDGNSVCDAGIWLSADGTTWELVATGTELSGAPTAVAEGPDGLVVVGGTCPETAEGGMGPCAAAAWTSPDGRAWSPVPVSPNAFGCPNEPGCDFRLEGIVQGGPGLLTWGGGFDGHRIWTSVDGLEWQPADMDGSGVMLSDIVSLGNRLVAVGTVWTDIFDEAGEWVSFTEDLSVWTSTDGVAWSELRDPTFEGASGGRVAVSTQGITVIGAECDENWVCRDMVWHSPNGLVWTQTPLDLGVDDAGVFSMVAGGPGLIASGSVYDALDESETTLFWTSSDGLTWNPFEPDPDVFVSGDGINDFAWFGDRLIGVGASPVDRAPAVWIWTP